MTGQIRHVHTNAVADGTATSVVRPSDWNSIHAYTMQDGVSLGGNTAGVLAEISSGTLLLAGGNNITLSQNANSVTISAGAGGAGSDTVGMSNLGNTAGTSGVVSGSAVRLLLAGGNNITLSQSIDGVSATLTVSAFNQSAQTQNLHNLTLAGNTAGALAHVSSGTLTLAGGNNVTLSQAGNAITISGPNTAAQTIESNTLGMSNLGNTAGTSGVVSAGQVRYVLAGGNNVTLSQSLDGASATLTISAFNQTVQTQNLHNVTLAGNTAGVLAHVSSGTLTLAGGNNITLSQNGNAVTISGGAGGAGLGGLAAGTQTATSGTIVFSDSNGISFGMSGSTRVTASYTVPTVPAQFSGGISGGNTAGDTGSVTGRVLLAGGNNITLSGSTNGGSMSITVSAANIPAQSQESQSFGMSNLGNTSGTTGMASGAQVRFALAGGNNITLSQSIDGASGTITISAANAGVGAAINRSAIEILEGDLLTHACSITGVSYSKRPIFVPFWLDGENLSVKTINLWASRPAGTSLNMTYGAGFYSAINSTQLSLVSSTTNAVSLTASGQFSGVRRYEITGLSGLTLSEGRWIMALLFSGSNNSTAVANLVLYGGQTMFGVNGYVFPGTNSTGATSGSEHFFPFWGVYSATSDGFPASVARSEISGPGSNDVNADIYAVIREI